MSARILVVDDSASMRQMVSFALTSAGFSVDEAEDGQVALGRAQGQRFNAVVNPPRPAPAMTTSRIMSDREGSGYGPGLQS